MTDLTDIVGISEGSVKNIVNNQMKRISREDVTGLDPCEFWLFVKLQRPFSGHRLRGDIVTYL